MWGSGCLSSHVAQQSLSLHICLVPQTYLSKIVVTIIISERTLVICKACSRCATVGAPGIGWCWNESRSLHVHIGFRDGQRLQRHPTNSSWSLNQRQKHMSNYTCRKKHLFQLHKFHLLYSDTVSLQSHSHRGIYPRHTVVSTCQALNGHGSSSYPSS